MGTCISDADRFAVFREVHPCLRGLQMGGVKTTIKGGVSVCLRLSTFACVCLRFRLCVCLRLSVFVCVCSHLLAPPLLRPPLRDTDSLHGSVCSGPHQYDKIATQIFVLGDLVPVRGAVAWQSISVSSKKYISVQRRQAHRIWNCRWP